MTKPGRVKAGKVVHFGDPRLSRRSRKRMLADVAEAGGVELPGS
ncbi:hypothetical protein [Streptomyces bluensis]|uniref:Uncharacterized protein n=1 Tax=Streptomyces bluensis TaxID=33897 RepID=A0ABW6UDD4_9ACTN